MLIDIRTFVFTSQSRYMFIIEINFRLNILLGFMLLKKGCNELGEAN